VDQTIDRLGGANFVVDPIAGPDSSKITSITSSAYKRHGAIIEISLFLAIAQRNAGATIQRQLIRPQWGSTVN
jgi:hypothetical protein